MSLSGLRNVYLDFDVFLQKGACTYEPAVCVCCNLLQLVLLCVHAALNAFGECIAHALSEVSVAQSCTLPLLPFCLMILCIRKKATSSIVMKRGRTCSITRITCRHRSLALAHAAIGGFL